MRKNKKTVFFGPFVGEFGWEILYWQGWVKKLCRGKYKMYRKIACSFPGRNPLYPDVNEFWSLPKWFLKDAISSRAYHTDNWINGLPKPNKKADLVDVLPRLKKVVKEIKEKLPADTVFVSPWKLIKDPENRALYGTFIPKNPKSDEEFVSYFIPYEKQILEHLQPTNSGINLLKKVVNPKQKIIAVFPRCRIARRPDKNWSNEKYEELIEDLQSKFPSFKIAIFGEPGGAYFTEGVPKGCIDLINIKPEDRLDIQLAALKQSVLAIGGESGGLVFALATGCRVFCWGHVSFAKEFKRENYMKSEQIFLSDNNPPVGTVFSYVRWILTKNKRPYLNQIRSYVLIKSYYLIPGFVRKSKRLAKFKQNIIGKS